MGGATLIAYRQLPLTLISIHAPRGGSDPPQVDEVSVGKFISIHAPRGGSDRADSANSTGGYPFQSTLPVGGATGGDFVTIEEYIKISIHAPRGGSDQSVGAVEELPEYFNPRSPWGERRTSP